MKLKLIFRNVGILDKNGDSEPIYGINTGFGSLCNVKISNENLSKLRKPCKIACLRHGKRSAKGNRQTDALA
jgi:hypothetical protein